MGENMVGWLDYGALGALHSRSGTGASPRCKSGNRPRKQRHYYYDDSLSWRTAYKRPHPLSRGSTITVTGPTPLASGTSKVGPDDAREWVHLHDSWAQEAHCNCLKSLVQHLGCLLKLKIRGRLIDRGAAAGESALTNGDLPARVLTNSNCQTNSPTERASSHVHCKCASKMQTLGGGSYRLCPWHRSMSYTRWYYAYNGHRGIIARKVSANRLSCTGTRFKPAESSAAVSTR